MPLYEYECTKCGRRTEKIQKFSDRPLTTCPHCKGPVKKLPSAPAIQFKGSGWYVTDYGKSSGSSGSGESKGEKQAREEKKSSKDSSSKESSSKDSSKDPSSKPEKKKD